MTSTSIRWSAVGLLLAILVVYFPVWNFEFLNWDDTWYIVRNDLIKSWHPANLFGILTRPVARNFAPATISTFLVEHSLWQLWPGGYHVTNVLIHMVNAVLVLLLIRQLTGNDWLAWIVAALFAVHPIQVESVAWVSSRKTLLSSTFMLASLLCWLRPDRTDRQEAWGIGWLVLALLSKASAVTMPPLVLAYDILIARKKLSDSIARQLVPMVLCVLMIYWTMNAQVTIVGGTRGHLALSKPYLMLVNLTLLWRYVGMLLWPVNLCVMYDPPVEGIWPQILVAAAGWGLVVWMLWRVRYTQPLLTFAGIAWILLLLPMLNLFPLTTLMNDRYLYLPCIPFFAVVGWMINRGWQQITLRVPQMNWCQSGLAVTASAAMIGLASWGTLNYLPIWKDPLSLWSYARQQTPSLTVVQVQWALTLEKLGRYVEAAQVLKLALKQTDPDEPEQKMIDSLLDRIEKEARGTAA